jgi:ABC-2 type transport system ATP-binding protein
MGIIVCSNIVKKFGDYTALNSVNLDIPQGKIFGLLGPNGAGKTTLIRIINQITVPDSGSVVFNGHKMVPADVESIGYLPEERGLYKKMKVGDQALYLAKLKGMSTADATRELKQWFVKFGIQAWWNKKVEELSKGMAQKVQFITTVMHKPNLLILDEPFSGFDPVNVQIIRDEMLKLKAAGATIILSTHNMESVEELCDNIALINKSNLIITGEVDAIRREHGNNQVEVLYRSSEELSGYLKSDNGLSLDIVSDEPHNNVRRAVIERKNSTYNSDILGVVIKHVDVMSYQELIPRMNDIFIKLVSESNNK